MPRRWQAGACKTVSDLTGPRLEPQTSCSRREFVIAIPTDLCDWELNKEAIFVDSQFTG